MWTDLQCHSVFECGMNADTGFMIDYNEKNPLSPVQPCRCLDAQRSTPRTDVMSLLTMLPDNCDACIAHAPLGDRPEDARVIAQDPRCALVPRGSLTGEKYPEHRRDMFDASREFGDFMCLAADPFCRDPTSATVDAHWIGWDDDQEDVMFQTHSYLMAEQTSAPAGLYTYCGHLTDKWTSVTNGRCICAYNSARGRGAVPFEYWDNVVEGFSYCSQCKSGYKPFNGTTENGGVCVRHILDCVLEHPDHPMAVRGVVNGAEQWMCVDPAEFCAVLGGLDASVVDAYESAANQVCVCSGDWPQYGKVAKNPLHPELGPLFQCWPCNNADGYFDLSAGCQNYPDIRGPTLDWPEFTFLVRDRIMMLRRGYWERFIPHGFGTWPEDDIRDLWWSYPMGTGVVVTGNNIHNRPTQQSVPTELVLASDELINEWMWALIHYRRSANHPQERSLFQYWVCGQASDPTAEAEGVCRCVEHANHRVDTHLPPSQDEYAAFYRGVTRDECFCDEGYAFDRLSRSCRPHAEICGAAAYTNITYGCVCLNNVEHDSHGKCTKCTGDRFRSMDGCPDIHVWCHVDADNFAGMDVDATKATDTCTCKGGFLPFGQQADGIPGCHSCADDSNMAAVSNGNRVCVPVSLACIASAYPSRLDTAQSIIKGTCTCRRGWAWNNATKECDIQPAGTMVHAPSDSVVFPSACGPGVHEENSLQAGRCVCDTSRHFVPTMTLDVRADACRACEVGKMLMTPPNSVPGSPLFCMSAAEACGTGTDEEATNQQSACVCKPGFLPFADQPTGSCEDCDVRSGFYRPHVEPSECILPSDDMLRAEQVPDVAAWNRVMKLSFESGMASINAGIQGACGMTWKESYAWDADVMVLRPSAMIVPLKNTSHSMEEARAACQAFFPCGGFVAFEMAVLEATPIYRFVYLTHHAAYRLGTTNVNPAAFAQSTVMSYVSTWTLRRAETAACADVTVDPAWYWSTWQHRLVDVGLPSIMTAIETDSQWPDSIRGVLQEPQAVSVFHNLFGHQMGLRPNPWCRIGPLPADPDTGCRARTCRSHTTCPQEFPVEISTAIDPNTHNLCFAEDVTSRGSEADPWNYSSWSVLGYDNHPAPCQQGVCMFDWREGGTFDQPVCRCPTTGVSGTSADACDSGENMQVDSGTGVCRYPPASNYDISVCGELDNELGIGCPTGRFGSFCTLYDADGYCHPAGSSDPMCSGHGRCVPGEFPHLPQCACDDGYAGAYCGHPSCDQGCGPFGRCVVVSTPGQTEPTFHCACAVADDDDNTPLAASADVLGTCTVDLCNDNTGGKERHGNLVMDADGRTAPSGAPIGQCVCRANRDGVVNSGTFCDETHCAEACGVPDEHLESVCVSCSEAGMANTPFCGGDTMGSQCDCDSSLRGPPGEYWRVRSHRYVTSSTPLTVGSIEFRQCTPYCMHGGEWDASEQRCVCGANGQWTGDRCEQEACVNGFYNPVQDECLACHRQFRISFDTSAKRICSLCAPGYTGSSCTGCAENYVEKERFDSADGTLCVPCNEAVNEQCFLPGVAQASCPDPHTVLCECALGYVGQACDLCDTENGFWMVTQSDIDNHLVLGDVVAGQCVAAGAWNGCTRANVASWHVNPQTKRPYCTCAYPYSDTKGAPPGNPGDCSWCNASHAWSVSHQACIPCSDFLGCDGEGSTGAVCNDPMSQRENATAPGERNMCVCNSQLGRGGPLCSGCDIDGGWVPIPNTEPVMCHFCDRDCGPNGNLLCGFTNSRCECRGGWSGSSCEYCTYCGIGGTCLPALDPGDPFCACNTSMGYTLDRELLGTPNHYRARCSSCVDGFFRVGRRCLPVEEMCGEGADVEATIQTGECTCKANYKPLQQQHSSMCTECEEGFFRGPDGTCSTCSPACGNNAVCAWNEQAEQYACACVSNYAEHEGECSVCAPGSAGPFCQTCPSVCTDSGGSCQWAAQSTSASEAFACVCPDGMTNLLPGNVQSACRACVPGEEVGINCAACLTCGPNAACSPVDGSCECLPGFYPAFEHAPSDLMNCVALDELSQRTTHPPVATHTMFEQLDLPSLAMAMLLFGGLVACLAGCALVLVTSHHRYMVSTTTNAAPGRRPASTKLHELDALLGVAPPRRIPPPPGVGPTKAKKR